MEIAKLLNNEIGNIKDSSITVINGFVKTCIRVDVQLPYQWNLILWTVTF